MKKENNAIVITSIISAVVLVIAFASLVTFNSMSPYQKDTLTVEGIASIDVMPDLISVYFNIETTGETSAEAKDANSEIFNKLVNGLTTSGFERDEIVSESYSIYPDYDWKNGERIEKGYRAVHNVKVELNAEDLEKLTNVIDAGVNAGAGISYINFELTQESQSTYKAQALELAAKDAQLKAESVASGFDKDVGKLISVSINEFGYYPWNVYTASSVSIAEDAALAKESVSNIQPGEKTIDARVSATFKLR